MHIPAPYFRNSFVAELFELTDQHLEYLLTHAQQGLLVKLLLLNVWGQVCLWSNSQQAATDRLREHISFTRLE